MGGGSIDILDGQKNGVIMGGGTVSTTPGTTHEVYMYLAYTCIYKLTTHNKGPGVVYVHSKILRFG